MRAGASSSGVSLTTEYLLLTTCYSLLTTHYLLLTTYYVPRTTYHVLLTTYHVLRTTYYVPRTTYHVLLTTYHALLTTYYLPDRLLLTTYRCELQWPYYLLLTTYYLLRTTYHVLQVRAPVAGLGRARRARARLDAAGPDAGRHSQRRQRPQPQCTHHAVLVGVGGDQRGAAPQHLDRCGRVFPYERRAAVPMRIQPRRVCGKLLRSPLAWFIWRLAHARGFSSHKGYPEGKFANKALLLLKRLKRQRWQRLPWRNQR